MKGAATPSQHQVEPRETLWSIAADRLGSSLRWRELAELNYGIRQADGEALTTAHWVTVGWLLQLPVTTNGSRPHAQKAEAHWSNANPPLTDGGTPTVSERAVVGSVNRSRQNDCRPPPTAPVEAQSVAIGDDGGHLVGPPLVPVGGSVVGAGVVSILDRMRRAQQRRRSSGRFIKLPDRVGTRIEQRLRIGDGSETVSIIDLSLRLLINSGTMLWAKCLLSEACESSTRSSNWWWMAWTGPCDYRITCLPAMTEIRCWWTAPCC